MESIDRRVSVRRFTEETVGDDEVRQILRAAMAAPSAGNQQPWEFFVVRDCGLRRVLAEAGPYTGPVGRAPVAIVYCMSARRVRFAGEAPQDMAACVENAWLEATELGLGAVWMSIYPTDERMGNVREALDLPHELVPFALMAVGHPLEQPEAKGPSRYDEDRIAWR